MYSDSDSIFCRKELEPEKRREEESVVALALAGYKKLFSLTNDCQKKSTCLPASYSSSDFNKS